MSFVEPHHCRTVANCSLGGHITAAQSRNAALVNTWSPVSLFSWIVHCGGGYCPRSFWWICSTGKQQILPDVSCSSTLSGFTQMLASHTVQVNWHLVDRKTPLHLTHMSLDIWFLFRFETPSCESVSKTSLWKKKTLTNEHLFSQPAFVWDAIFV